MPGPLHTGHEARVAAGVSFVRADLPALVESLEGVPRDIERLHFRRQKISHRGIADLRNLRCLWARQANQEFIEEISRLENLELLHVDGLTANALTALGRNRKLRRLLLIGGTKIEDLDWVASLPSTLEVLFLENFSRVSDVSAIGQLSNLTALGIEGGITTHVRIDTLAPLARLHHLRSLFLASARVQDKSLSPLHRLTRLERLECTARFPDREFIELRNSLPNLECQWIKMIEEHGSLRAWNAAMMARIRGRR